MGNKIGSFLTEVLPKEHLWKVKLFQNWDSIIGVLSGKVRIEKLEGEVLVLGVCHPAWAQELFMLSGVLKDKINKVLEEERIKDIRFRTVRLKTKRVQKSRAKKVIKDVSLGQNIENIDFSVNEKASLDRVKSDDLRHSLKNYYVRCKKGCACEKGIRRTNR